MNEYKLGCSFINLILIENIHKGCKRLKTITKNKEIDIRQKRFISDYFLLSILSLNKILYSIIHVFKHKVTMI